MARTEPTSALVPKDWQRTSGGRTQGTTDTRAHSRGAIPGVQMKVTPFPFISTKCVTTQTNSFSVVYKKILPSDFSGITLGTRK